MCPYFNGINWFPVLAVVILSSNFIVVAAYFLRTFVGSKLDPILFNEDYWAMVGEERIPAFTTRRAMLYLVGIGFTPFARKNFPGEDLKQHFSLQFQVFCHLYALFAIVTILGSPVVFLWYIADKIC